MIGADYFKGLDTAKVNDRKYPDRLTEGTFELEIVKCEMKKSEKNGAEWWQNTFTVVTSSNPAHPVGSKVTTSIFIFPLEANMPRLKAFLYAVVGADALKPEERAAKFDPQIKELAAKAVGDNLLAGRKVFCKAVTKPQKEDPSKTSTYYNYSSQA